ncbi:2-hydroxychromene-2-carboxylate isomerase [Paractinoplanes rishiriensis]|uniref:2-hydroxychromene-2-carboxylate isomerase n=1 Tax=Paractinoplanes rishiriensis TaxID=1050105 RepID=A0A919K9J9_9ACTN|nr:DsbA family protein [Actinoplanes rishiriensis]GIF02270.1 2-hydroxychromene-2-carboxylate isomerase [Actinoplanes rishiriensis]
MTAKTPRFFFSLRSPYSWLAYHDLTERHPHLVGTIEWVPYWEPSPATAQLLADLGGEFLYTEMHKSKQLYVLQDVRRLAGARGFAVTWPVDKEPEWEVPHLAYLAAAELGRGHDFIRAVHEARWQRGQDICDRATVGLIAEEAGLDPDLLAGAHEIPRIRAAGVRLLLTAYQTGVFGVPFFAAGRQKFWGVDRLDGFLQAIGATAAPAPAAPEVAVAGAGRGGDVGHAGGCG